MTDQLNPKINYWNNAFKAFLDFPSGDKNAFNFGTFAPEKTPTLTVQFIEEQSLKYPALNIPIFEDYKGWFSTPPKPPTPPSKTEISQKADKKYFGYEPDRELWKGWRYDWEMQEYEKNMMVFEQAKNQFHHFCRVNKKTETGYLLYLKTHYPPIQKFLATPFQRPLKFEDRLKHCYITGNTGSGKSELIKYLVYPFLIEKNPSSAVVVVDPNGDMALEIAQFKEFYQNDRLVYFDPFLNAHKIPVINPFFMETNKTGNDYADTQETLDKTAQSLMNVFEEMIEGIGGASLTNQMNALLFPCLYSLLDLGDQSLADLQTFMKQDDNRGLLEQGKNSKIKAHREFFNNSFNLDGYKTTKHGIYTKILSLVNSPIFYDCIMGKNTISLEECLKQKKIIIFNLSKGRMGESSAQALGRFVLARVLAFASNQSAIDIEKRTNVHLIIDECQNYISSFYTKILTETRKYGLYLTLAQQICGQGMKTDLIGSVLSCTDLKLTGINSTKTLKTISDETGANMAELEAMDTGVFHFKVDKNKFKKPSLPVKIPEHLLGSKHSMSKEQWKKTTQEQLDKYYRFTEEFDIERGTGTARLNEVPEDIFDFGF